MPHEKPPRDYGLLASRVPFVRLGLLMALPDYCMSAVHIFKNG